MLQTNSLGKICDLSSLSFQPFVTGRVCFCFLLKTKQDVGNDVVWALTRCCLGDGPTLTKRALASQHSLLTVNLFGIG